MEDAPVASILKSGSPVHWAPFAILLAFALVPFVANDYWTLIATRAAIYWVLVSGLNLLVGFAGQLAIGYVALLTLGAYTASVLSAGTISPPVPAFVALLLAGVVGAVSGLVVGLPALRLRTFYFAITTLGFATIVTQIALAWQDVTGGGVGIAGPELPAPLQTSMGFFFFCLCLAIFCTWTTANIARSRFGRSLIAIRDVEVAAEASGIFKPRMLFMFFLLSGAFAGVAGGLFASLQTYITPDAFTFDLSILFFISILIGGRGSITGPLLGTIILTVLPELSAPLAAWSAFLYAALLLVIVLLVPGGIAALIETRIRQTLPKDRAVLPNPSILTLRRCPANAPQELILKGIVLRFGAVKAIDGLDLLVKPGRVHGLIGPNGSGKTTTLNVISGYYKPQSGYMALGDVPLPFGSPHSRAKSGIARTFQTPRIAGEISVLENVMIGGGINASGTFVEALFQARRSAREEKDLERDATRALSAVGLASLADVRADQLQHTELRFLEIARALMNDPAIMLLDEPAAGLSPDEVSRLGDLVKAISRQGVSILLVEHHADLVFAICDHVTVLNLGKVLASGSPNEIRGHREVVSAYLGA